MAQNLIPTIDPTVVNGTTLATDWGTTLAALLSSHSGTARPAYAVAGTFWLNSGTNTLNYYDGTTDIPVMTFDTTNHLFNPPVGGGTNVLASATTVDLGSVPQAYVSITGATPITSFGTSAKVGQIKFINFAAALTLTYNATSMILPGGANITTAAGDNAIVLYLGSGNWRCLDYTSASGTSLLAYNASGFVNQFRNAGMDVAQRGTSGTVSAGTVVTTLDGWKIASIGAASTWGQQTGTGIASGVLHGLVLTGAAGVTEAYFTHNIESSMSATLAGQQVTIQFAVYNGTGASFAPAIQLNYANAIDNFSTTTSITGILTQYCTGGLSTVAYTFAMPSANVPNGLQVTLDLGNAINGAGKFVIISAPDIRVTPGVSTGLNSNPPKPEIRPVGIEFPFSQRYLPAFTAGVAGSLPIGYGTQSSVTGSTIVVMPFQVPPRVAPTGLTVSSSSNFNLMTSGGSQVTCGTITYWSASRQAGAMTVANAGLSNGLTALLFSNTAAAQLLWTGCEL